MDRLWAVKQLIRMRDRCDQMMKDLQPTAVKYEYLKRERAVLNTAARELNSRPRQKEIAKLLKKYLDPATEDEVAEDIEAELQDWVESVYAKDTLVLPLDV